MMHFITSYINSNVNLPNNFFKCIAPRHDAFVTSYISSKVNLPNHSFMAYINNNRYNFGSIKNYLLASYKFLGSLLRV